MVSVFGQSAMETLVLFDIDGTLLHTHGAGKLAFSRALERVFGWKDDLSHISFAGATDLVVLHRLMREHGATPSPADDSRFFEQLPVELEQTVLESNHTLYPGVGELLDTLTGHEGCLVGLVTGNIETCARIKLRLFDLERHFRFGGYGDDHADRAEITRIAVSRARAHAGDGGHIHSVCLIGDSLSDVAAARANDALSIAVTTGWHEGAELRAAGADHVLRDLSDTRRLLQLMGVTREGCGTS